MPLEIERRFLVDGRNEKPWRSGDSDSIFQCYLTNVTQMDGMIIWNENLLIEENEPIENITTWRIRLNGDVATLTAKGRKTGATATEFEWNLPLELYNSLDLDGLPSVQKTRYYWHGSDGLTWEVDEYEDSIAGLVIAEIELEKEDQEVALPEWLGLEITHLAGWSNASLSRMIKDSKSN